MGLDSSHEHDNGTQHTRGKTMESGDLCYFVHDAYGRPDFTVHHVECDEYPDGTVTDARTGEILRRV